MKICLLADGESIHTIRWCNHFYARGHKIDLITFKNTAIEGIQVHYVNSGTIKVEGGNWKVILKWRQVKKIIQSIQPDVVHSFYATSYGLVGALSDFLSYIVSLLVFYIFINLIN